MGCIKMHQINPQLIINLNLIETLYTLIRDTCPHVIVNAIHAINEILSEDGGIVIS